MQRRRVASNFDVIDRAQARIMASISGQERSRQAFSMFAFMRDTIRRNLREEHAEWSEGELRKELLWRLHGIDIRVPHVRR